MLSSNFRIKRNNYPLVVKVPVHIQVGCVVSELLSIKETRSVGVVIFYNID